jgi:hypothetical protein
MENYIFVPSSTDVRSNDNVGICLVAMTLWAFLDSMLKEIVSVVSGIIDLVGIVAETRCNGLYLLELKLPCLVLWLGFCSTTLEA